LIRQSGQEIFKIFGARLRNMKENQGNQTGQEIRYHMAGWILFIICAGFFLAASLKNHDTLTAIGSIIFFIACIVFLIPLVRSVKSDE
jgi:predicted membrane channel-forming protein YqfA (hemolysin III family)